MTPDLEEMIRQRAHAIWEREGRPHGRHEEHWQMAAAEITEELERIKADHVPTEGGEAPEAPRKGRQRRTGGDTDAGTPRPRRASKADAGAVSGKGETVADPGPQDAPPKRGRKAKGEAQAEVAPSAAKTTRRRAAKGTEDAQPAPSSETATKTRHRTGKAAEASSEAGVAEAPVRRGRKPRGAAETIH